LVSDPAAVDKLEARLRVRLPADYRDYLMRYGYIHSGNPVLFHLAATVDLGTSVATKEIVVQQLSLPGDLSLDGVTILGIESEYEDFQESDVDPEGAQIPPEMLPIGIGAADTEGRFLLDLSQ